MTPTVTVTVTPTVTPIITDTAMPTPTPLPGGPTTAYFAEGYTGVAATNGRATFTEVLNLLNRVALTGSRLKRPRAGRLGGNAVSQDREHMARIGRKDGKTPKRHGVPEEDGSQSRGSV